MNEDAIIKPNKPNKRSMTRCHGGASSGASPKSACLRAHTVANAASSAGQPATTIGALANEVFRAETPGFRAFASDPDAAAAMLDPLIETARAAVPAHLRPRTPLTLRATAGLRLLPEGPEAADAILAERRAGARPTHLGAVRDAGGGVHH